MVLLRQFLGDNVDILLLFVGFDDEELLTYPACYTDAMAVRSFRVGNGRVKGENNLLVIVRSLLRYPLDVVLFP